ncbi:nuclear transport factor 2 family protein [Piscinibacter terrae]|nr:nuclear transport factor 2 family protein [Albitalea terrae]
MTFTAALAAATLATAACTDPSLLRLVDDYVTLHDTPSIEGIERLFTPRFVVQGPNLSGEPTTTEGYLAFLQSLKGLRFRKAPGTEVAVDDEGHLVLHFVVTQGDKTLARGVDTITLEDGKISRVVGVY